MKKRLLTALLSLTISITSFAVIPTTAAAAPQTDLSDVQVAPEFDFTGQKIAELPAVDKLTVAANLKFENNQELEKVVIPENYVLSGSLKFSRCPNLKEIVMPELATELWVTITECDKLASFTMPVSPQTDLTQFSYVTVSNCKSMTELEVSNARRMYVKDMPALETLKLTASPHATSDDEYYNIDYASCPKLKDIYLYNADVQPTPKEAALMAENGITIHCPAADGWGTYLGHYNVNYTFIDAEALQGDANCDGNVDMADAVLIMQSIANPSKYKLTGQGRKNADTDGDGITSGDALAIQKKLLRLDGADVPDIDPSLLANTLFISETEGKSGFNSISFGDDGRFNYFYGKYFSAAQDFGTWTISGDTVILKGQYGTNSFRYKDDTLICIAEDSEGFGYNSQTDSENFIKVKENS